MKFELKDATVLKRAVSAISEFTEEANFNFTTDGLSIKAMDVSRIAMVDYALNRKAFRRYDFDKDITAGLSLSRLAQIMSRCSAGDSIEFTVKEDSVVIVITNKRKRRFTMGLREVEMERGSIPQLEWTATLDIDARLLKDCLTDASLFSEHIILEVTDKFKANASSDKGIYNLELPKDSLYAIPREIKEPTKAKYSIEMIERMLKVAETTARVSIGKDLPVKVTYGSKDSDGRFEFILAPIVEVED